MQARRVLRSQAVCTTVRPMYWILSALDSVLHATAEIAKAADDTPPRRRRRRRSLLEEAGGVSTFTLTDTRRGNEMMTRDTLIKRTVSFIRYKSVFVRGKIRRSKDAKISDLQSDMGVPVVWSYSSATADGEKSVVGLSEESHFGKTWQRRARGDGLDINIDPPENKRSQDTGKGRRYPVPPKDRNK
ncbi:hypothetical protein F2P81_008229 [Scophthalmus maximus]|uniref:Uncharacterized protein n=1 Tax=Scophthalmus maximus TaxID=52904 RepID=A0A6A4TA07_SCOMX|nr:hypothetical protein F2P81_008229 [Scophthalmus maximus]